MTVRTPNSVCMTGLHRRVQVSSQRCQHIVRIVYGTAWLVGSHMLTFVGSWPFLRHCIKCFTHINVMNCRLTSAERDYFCPSLEMKKLAEKD